MTDRQFLAVLLLALAVCLGDAVATASLATAGTSYHFTATDVQQCKASASALPGRNPPAGTDTCVDACEGHATYQLTLTAPILAAIQSAVAAGVDVTITWQTQWTFSPKGETEVGERATISSGAKTLYHNTPALEYMDPGDRKEVNIFYAPQLTQDKASALGVGSVLTVDLFGTAFANIPDSHCGQHVMLAYAEWELYYSPKLEIGPY